MSIVSIRYVGTAELISIPILIFHLSVVCFVHAYIPSPYTQDLKEHSVAGFNIDHAGLRLSLFK